MPEIKNGLTFEMQSLLTQYINRFKIGKHRITFIDAEKSFEKNSISIPDKNSQKTPRMWELPQSDRIYKNLQLI